MKNKTVVQYSCEQLGEGFTIWCTITVLFGAIQQLLGILWVIKIVITAL